MKGSLEILVGISGSGKSSYAHEQWMLYPDNVTLINRDKIRELLFGFTEESIKDYYEFRNMGKFEKKVTRYEDTLINDALNHGNRVIVDATHLSRKYIERFRYWNVPTTIKFFDVDLAMAQNRNLMRPRKVDSDIITKQHSKFTNLVKNLNDKPIDFTPVTLDNGPINEDNAVKPSCIIFDIDGTLAHKGNRSPYDWLKVRQDSEDMTTCYLLDLVADTNFTEVIICTGRDGVSLEETERWLYDYNLKYDKIYIRDEGDVRADWIVKEEMWRDIAKTRNIIGMFDDRLQVVRRARALGLKVFNVAYNNF